MRLAQRGETGACLYQHQGRQSAAPGMRRHLPKTGKPQLACLSPMCVYMYLLTVRTLPVPAVEVDMVRHTSIDDGEPSRRRPVHSRHEKRRVRVRKVANIHGAQPRDGGIRVGALDGRVVMGASSTGAASAGAQAASSPAAAPQREEIGY